MCQLWALHVVKKRVFTFIFIKHPESKIMRGIFVDLRQSVVTELLHLMKGHSIQTT